MSEEISKTNEVVKERVDFLVFVSSKNGNPNGDPDNGNAPRIDTATEHGVITEVSIKHLIRMAVKAIFGENIMIDKENMSIELACKKTGNKDKTDIVSELVKMYWDIRAFGGVFGSKGNPITGPVQIGIGTSIDKIIIHVMSIMRCIPNDLKENKNGDIECNSQPGNKAYQTYGLYRFSGEINPFKAEKTGFTYGDMDKLFKGISQAYTQWCSAQKGETETVKVIVFRHSSALGNAKKSQLNDCVSIRLRDGVTVPTDYSDYEITIDESKIPAGVTVEVID